MSKIYVVTKGEYDAYRILTATTDKELAEKIAKRFDEKWIYDRTQVEVYENAELYLLPIYIIWFDIVGNIEQVNLGQGEPDGIFSDEFDDCYDDVEYDKENGIKLRVYNNNLSAIVQADNEEHAIKIASEKRAEFLARNAGIA